MSNKSDRLNPNDIPIRDYFMVDIIKGVTKSGYHLDRKKQQNKNKCRDKIIREDD